MTRGQLEILTLLIVCQSACVPPDAPPRVRGDAGTDATPEPPRTCSSTSACPAPGYCNLRDQRCVSFTSAACGHVSGPREADAPLVIGGLFAQSGESTAASAVRLHAAELALAQNQ